MNIAFYPFWAAKTLLSLINVIYIMVITTLIYGQTGSVLYAALFPFIQMSARIVAGYTAPLLVKRFALSRLMVNIPLAKTLTITGIAIAFTDLTAHIPFLLAGIALLSLLDGWESLLINTLTPRLVQGEDLAKANHILSFSTQTVTILGYAMTGFIVMYWGASQTFWAATTLSWVVLILMMTISSLMRDTAQQTPFQSNAPVEFLFKAYALHGIILSAAMSLLTVIFGLIADQTRVPLAYWIGGMLVIVSTLCSFRLNRIKTR